MEDAPKVCVAVILINSNNQVLLGQRKNIRGDGLYQFPGGHLEFCEDFPDTALRELREEAGNLEIELIDAKFPFASVSEHFDGKKHYVVNFIRARYLGGQIINKQPDKNSGWDWYPWDALPQPLFSGIQYLIDNRRKIDEEPK
jgi:8-oxo-dGTP diphosphatase